jgi:hypothetical protein
MRALKKAQRSRVVTVSLETVWIVAGLPGLEG